jgi:argininosuccinate lyase
MNDPTDANVTDMHEETLTTDTVTTTANPPSDGAAAKRVWEARTGGATAARFLAFSESTATDVHFLEADLAGSITHVAGLHAAGLLTKDEASTLVTELQALAHAGATGNFVLDPALEDVHMNIEAKITASLGALGAKLHTGRSRNDQVATCLVLYARSGLAMIAGAAAEVAAALQEQATEHIETPWLARTHGQPAQPATLGFFLAAHAYRFQSLATSTLQVFETIGESPLGAGAVAGSTLPLDPAATARLMGLRPLCNALLATGTRDPVVQAVGVAAQAGAVAASLAEDLLQSARIGAFASPPAFTSGSSLMPQKRNPDALELVRGKGKGLLGPYVQVQQVTSGLPLGYHRDYQETKPPLVQALHEATASLQVLAAVLTGGTFLPGPLSAEYAVEGITATDAAEALVANGVPFRSAYTAVAHAIAASLDGGVPIKDTLTAEGLPQAAIEAALHALTPDPSRRATHGGPAPTQVAKQLDDLATAQAAIDAQVQTAKHAAHVPFLLLETDPAVTLEQILTTGGDAA